MSSVAQNFSHSAHSTKDEKGNFIFSYRPANTFLPSSPPLQDYPMHDSEATKPMLSKIVSKPYDIPTKAKSNSTDYLELFVVILMLIISLGCAYGFCRLVYWFYWRLAYEIPAENLVRAEKLAAKEVIEAAEKALGLRALQARVAQAEALAEAMPELLKELKQLLTGASLVFVTAAE